MVFEAISTVYKHATGRTYKIGEIEKDNINLKNVLVQMDVTPTIEKNEYVTQVALGSTVKL